VLITKQSDGGERSIIKRIIKRNIKSVTVESGFLTACVAVLLFKVLLGCPCRSTPVPPWIDSY
jgi:hypothetical protein